MNNNIRAQPDDLNGINRITEKVRPMTRIVKAATALLLGATITGGSAACSRSADTGTSRAETPTVVSASPAAVAPLVVRKVTSEATLKEDYKTLGELAASPNAKLIISGTVVQAAPVYENPLAYTKLVVNVAKSSNSSVRVGSTVVIHRDGGLIPLSQVLPDLKDDPAAAPLPASAPANAVVDFEFMGAEQNAVGDDIVAFLHPDPNSGREGAYQAVSSVHGLLKLDGKTGNYHRLGELGLGYEAEISTAGAERFIRRL